MAQLRIEMRTVIVALVSPLVFALVFFFFWLALDEPPLPILALLICISGFVVIACDFMLGGLIDSIF